MQNIRFIFYKTLNGRRFTKPIRSHFIRTLYIMIFLFRLPPET